MVDELERLAKLHERGALTDDEYAAAKAEAPVSAGLRFYWLVVQVAAVAGGIYAGWWLFNWAT